MKRIALLIIVAALLLHNSYPSWKVSTYDTGRKQIVIVSYAWRF